MSTISVVIPCYNRAACIGQTLRNVLEQSRPPDEVIVVDDGSTDDSAAIVRTFGTRVILIEQENQGPGAARNRGLEACRGDYVWFMDSDDLASSNQLEGQFLALESSGCDLAYGPWIRSRINENGINFLGPVLQAEALPSDRSMLEWQLGTWNTVFQACLFRRSALDKTGRYRTDMRVGEDGEYLVRILAAGASTIFVGGSLLFYRSEGADQLSQCSDSAIRNAADLSRYFERIGETLGPRLLAFPPSVLRELAVEGYCHNRFCKKIGVGGIDASCPVTKVMSRIGLPTLRLLDYRNRFLRRLRRLNSALPVSRGIQWKAPGPAEIERARVVFADVDNSSAVLHS